MTDRIPTTEMIRESGKRTTSLVFFRHGKTDFPEERFYSRVNDPPLSSQGKMEAERLGRWVKSGSFSILYASPLKRTLETAAFIGRGSGLPVIPYPGLEERTMGEWDGLTPAEAKERDSEAFGRWKEDLLTFSPPGGESWAVFAARVEKTVRAIVSAHPDQKVAVVTHVGPIRVIVSRAMEIPDENHKRIVLGYGSATRIDYTKNWGNLAYLGIVPFDQEP